MLNHFKYFKYSKRLGFNLINDPKFAHKGLFYRFKKNWEALARPVKSATNLFWISKYFSITQTARGKQYLLFFKRKKFNENKLCKCSLDFCLLQARFCKTIRQARHFIFLGCVKVNGLLVKKPDFCLQEGDVTSFYPATFRYLFPYWKTSLFFSLFQTTKVFVQLPNSLEISYSSASFCFSFTSKLL
jgi:hypothetical protein